MLLIKRLSCSLVGQKQTIQIKPGTTTSRAYGTATAVEQFQCNYGLNQTHADEIGRGDLKITGNDQAGYVRIVEMARHPFFVATLYLPQINSKPNLPHPLIKAFIAAAYDFQALKSAQSEQA